MQDNQQDVANQTWTSPALRPLQPAAVSWKNAAKVTADPPKPKPAKLTGDARIAAATLASIERREPPKPAAKPTGDARIAEETLSVIKAITSKRKR